MPDKHDMVSRLRRLVADAALAHERFGSDELERYAEEYWAKREAKEKQMVNLHKPVQITIIDTVIDCPNVNEISGVCTVLSRGVIEGHRILHVQYNDPHPKDIIDVPHRGHGYHCDSSIVISDDCLALGASEPYKYKRYFNIQLVVEGNIYLPDLETCDYKVRDAMVLLVYTRIRPVAAELDRFELEAWR